MSAYSDPEYQRNRKRLLADQPPCAWCGKPATTADIAHAALFLVSPLSHQITGQTLVIDGGWTVVSPSPGETHFKEIEKRK